MQIPRPVECTPQNRGDEVRRVQIPARLLGPCSDKAGVPDPVDGFDGICIHGNVLSEEPPLGTGAGLKPVEGKLTAGDGRLLHFWTSALGGLSHSEGALIWPSEFQLGGIRDALGERAISGGPAAGSGLVSHFNASDQTRFSNF